MTTPVFGRSVGQLQDIEPPPPPIPFKIAGRLVVDRGDLKAGDWLEFEFHARGSIPMGSAMVLSSAAEGNEEEQTIAYLDYLWRCLVDDDRSRWRVLLDDAGILFEAELFAQITDWLAVQWTGRPLRSLSAPPAGPPAEISTSRAASRSQASRRASTGSR